MPSPDIPLTTLTIFLAKSGVTDPEAILKDPEAYDSYPMRIGGAFAGVLYIKRSRLSPPDWLPFIAPAIDEDSSELGLTTASAAAVWLIQRADHVFALTFGYGRYMLTDEGIDERFGIRCTLNAIDPEKIRSLDRKTFEKVQRHTREQVSRDSDLGAFGLDVEQDLLRAVTGTPNQQSYGHRLSGRDSLSATVRAELKDVPELLDRYLTLSKARTYEEQFPWVDNIAEVGDKSLSDSLFEEAVRRIRKGEHERIWLAPPEILDWSIIRGFSYRTAKSAGVYDDLALEDYLAEVNRAHDIEVKHLSSDRIYCVDTSGSAVGPDWNVKRCVCAEIDLAGHRYILSEGKWYRIDQDYVSRIERDVAELPSLQGALPAYSHEGELEYNQAVAEQSEGGYTLLDRQLISAGPSRGRVEVCDLYSPRKVLIHVKRYGGSSVLSHLFAQGLVSARLLQMDRAFRKDFNELLPVEHRMADPDTPIEPRDYEVAYAIIGPANRRLQLPFFSQVNLRNAASLLTGIGFRVSLTEIQHDAQR